MTINKIPCDAIWLDIEYTENKKYFTWDHEAFPNAKKLIENLVKDGRKLVTIIDPHIKQDEEYFVYKDILEKKLFVLDSDCSDPYVGWCWPKTSIWIDFMNPQARDYLASLYV